VQEAVRGLYMFLSSLSLRRKGRVWFHSTTAAGRRRQNQGEQKAMNAPSPRAAGAGDRDPDTAAGSLDFTITITGTGAHAAQSFTLAGDVIPPHAGGAQMHSHDHTVEWLYVVDGMVACALGEQTVTLTAGMVIVVPPSVAHAFWNPTPASATVLSGSAPARCDGFFAELAALRIAGGRAPPEKVGKPLG
jgi:mannose-6-phosphate isomerase-like protein (cupin superfamily)